MPFLFELGPIGLLAILLAGTLIIFKLSPVAGFVSGGITLVPAIAALAQARQDALPPPPPHPPGAAAEFGDTGVEEMERKRAMERGRARLRRRRP